MKNIASITALLVLAVGSFTRADAASTPPLVSITFDDAYRDPVDTGFVAYLEGRGYRATFYIPTQRVDMAGYLGAAELRVLGTLGHEVTAHTRTHPNLTQQSSAGLASEVVGSRDDMFGLGFNPRTFAYPSGSWNPTVAQAVENAGFVVARGTDSALNFPSTYRFNLQADSQKRVTLAATTKAWIDKANAEHGWYILLFHKLDRVGDDYSISSAMAKEIVDYIAQANIRVVTMREGACIYFNVGCDDVIR